jgi:hypothetical protein
LGNLKSETTATLVYWAAYSQEHRGNSEAGSHGANSEEDTKRLLNREQQCVVGFLDDGGSKGEQAENRFRGGTLGNHLECTLLLNHVAPSISL